MQNLEVDEFTAVKGELPPSLGRLQTIDNSKKTEANITEWRDVFFEGVPGKVRSDFVEVEVDGVRSKIRILIADFRDEYSDEQNVVINFTGFPGLNEGVRKKMLNGLYDESDVLASLDRDGLSRAASGKGLLIIPELQTLPVNRREKKQTFLLDAKMIEVGIDKVTEMSFDDRRKPKPISESTNVTLLGYSNGAGEAGAMAALLSGKGNVEGKIKLRLYSLIGVVPVPDMIPAFGREVWSIAMLEVATRYNRVFGTNFNGETDRKEILTELAKKLTTSEGRQLFLREVLSSLKGGEEGGNLQIGVDLMRRISKDVVGVLPHLRKYDNTEYLNSLGGNVNVELVVPRYDKIFWNKLMETMYQAAILDNKTDEIVDVLSTMYENGIPEVIEGAWWKALFPRAESVALEIMGEKRTDPESTHTGVVISAKKFIEARPKVIG